VPRPRSLSPAGSLGAGCQSLGTALRRQSYLGEESFVGHMQGPAEPRNSTDADIPRAQRRKSRTLAQWLASCENREEALTHTESALSVSAIARELGSSVSRASR